jgi:hypothetical protein
LRHNKQESATKKPRGRPKSAKKSVMPKETDPEIESGEDSPEVPLQNYPGERPNAQRSNYSKPGTGKSTSALSDPPCHLKTVRSEIDIMLMERDKKERAFVQSQGKKTSRKVSLNEDSEKEDADESYEGESPVSSRIELQNNLRNHWQVLENN